MEHALRKNCEIHIDVSHSRQPLVKGERLVRYEVNTVMLESSTRDAPPNPHLEDHMLFGMCLMENRVVSPRFAWPSSACCLQNGKGMVKACCGEGPAVALRGGKAQPVYLRSFPKFRWKTTLRPRPLPFPGNEQIVLCLIHAAQIVHAVFAYRWFSDWHTFVSLTKES